MEGGGREGSICIVITTRMHQNNNTTSLYIIMYTICMQTLALTSGPHSVAASSCLFVCVFRDLKAGNCSVGDHYLVKVADFKMSKTTSNGIYIHAGSETLPIKWTAPEGLRYQFTTKSDVWGKYSNFFFVFVAVIHLIRVSTMIIN